MHEYFYFVDFVRNVKIMEYGVAFLFIGLFALYYRFMMKPEAAPAMALHKAWGRRWLASAACWLPRAWPITAAMRG